MQLSGHVPLGCCLNPLLSPSDLPHLSVWKPICSDVSHNHVDSSANSVLKAITSLLSPSSQQCRRLACRLICRHTSGLHWWKSCQSTAAVVLDLSFGSLLCTLSTRHLDPVTELHLVKVLTKLLDDPAPCTLLAPRSACRLLPSSCTFELCLVLPTPPRAR